MHTYQHLLPGMSATAAEQFAALVATARRWTSTGEDAAKAQLNGHAREKPVDVAGDAHVTTSNAQAV